ncbi:MAG: HlyD family efflux transporter periplasmic adaptor subunit [Aureispira sp.]|nr:HlyD family efflux transporter periplasmic adaptor subunit [Aureispira sp.]
MNKIFRKISVLLGIAILIGGIMLASKIGNPPKDKEKTIDAVAAPENYVYTTIAKNKELSTDILVSGKLVPKQKIDIIAEVMGTLKSTKKALREGVSFRKGELIMSIDDTDTQLDLAATKSQLYSTIVRMLPDLEADYTDNFSAWDTYVKNFDKDKPIQELPKAKSEREKLYVAAKGLENIYLSIKRKEHMLTKFHIYAPFSGVLTSAAVQQGALVRAGQPLAQLMNATSYELEATVALADAQFFKNGSKVELYSEVTNQQWKGTVVRSGKTIDQKTQTQKIFVAVSGGNLNEGMFLNGKVASKTMTNVITIPRKLLVKENAIYTIKEDKLKLQTITLLQTIGNEVVIRGVEDGAVLLAVPVLGAYEGMPVKLMD